MKIKYQILPEGVFVEASQQETILDSSLRAGIQLNHSCGGHGTCGTCRIEVIHGLENFLPRNEIEAEIAADRGFKGVERLACQSLVCENTVVRHFSDTKKEFE